MRARVALPVLALLLAGALFAASFACGSGPGPTPTSTTTPSTVPPTSRPSQRYISTGQPPFDVTALFGTPRGAARDSGLNALIYPVTGGFNTGAGGFSGSIQGDLDGTPDQGTFDGVLRTEVGSCIAQRRYKGPLTASSIQWDALEQLNDCGGTSPLATPVQAGAVTTPPSVGSTIASTTVPTSTPTTTPTSTPTTIPTSAPTTSPTTAPSSTTTTTSTTTSIISTTTTTTTTTTTSAPATFRLTVDFSASPWCAPVMVTGTGGFSCTVSTPTGMRCTRDYTSGTNVQLDTNTFSTWAGCDTPSSSSATTVSCTLLMNRARTVTATYLGGRCSPFPPDVRVTSATSSGTNWVISYTANFFTPFAGWGVTVTATCGSGVVEGSAQTSASGTIQGSIMVPKSSCGTAFGGTLTIRDANVGAAQASWSGG